MPTEPVGFPQMGTGLQGGLQLVRDPSGHVILIHAAGNVTFRINIRFALDDGKETQLLFFFFYIFPFDRTNAAGRGVAELLESQR